MRKSFLLFCAALLLFASAGLFGKTIAVNTAADLLALNTGSFVIEEGDTVEFAPGGVFDITGTPWKGIYENRGTIRGNGATVILDDLARVKYAGIFTDPFTGEDYESYRYYGFVFLSSGAIEDLSFRIAGSMSHLAPRDGGLKGDVPAMDEGSVVCVRNSGTITGCSVDGGNNSFGVYTANYGAITAHNSCVVSSCRVWGLTLSFPEEQGYQGFIAGTNLKDILGCCVHDCAIARARYAGGICGISAGRLQDCAAWDLYFRSDTAYSRIGGITGILNNNDLMRCCAFGLNLTGGDTGGIAGFGDSCGLYSCYAVCDSNEGNEAGGLFGYGYYATCTSCFLPSGVIPAGKIHETEFHYDNLPLGQFTDGTLLGALGDGWYKGPGGYPLPFEYDVNVPVAGVALDL
ncbi:MAG: hypothetical protein J5758_05805, partial [Abditibacteriota bacterium]|nr:hypothetical protein [Abditibacteriota bacterium]